MRTSPSLAMGRFGVDSACKSGTLPATQMKSLLRAVLVLGLVLVGCGNNECEDAADKIDECGVDLGDSKPSDDENSECNDKYECNAKCVNAASCADMKAFYETGADNSFKSCIAACPIK